ncbi:FHA domain-containing protein [Thiofilum flexile]|uniref:FHA domain-containing protein n=1 Tax=Thiofilum flexile TaxID=125627 RepID=UPI000366BA50|nr:FHA domain-containing protein [Thiofilum flexile]
MPQLVIRTNNQIIKRVNLQQDSYTIGRHPSCDLVLGDKTVSNQHARISLRASKYLLEDLGSTNSTYVNQRAVQEYWLEDGDIIQLGRHTISYSAESHLNEQIAQLKTSADSMDSNAKAWLEIMNGRHAGARIVLKYPPDALTLQGDREQLLLRMLPNAYLLTSILPNGDEKTHQLTAGDVFSLDQTSFKLDEKKP